MSLNLGNQGNLENNLETISEMLNKIPTSKYLLLIIGDINIDRLKNNRDQIKLIETLLSHNVTHMDLPPTRITPTSKTSTDCVCTNLSHEYLDVSIIDTAISDHTA